MSKRNLKPVSPASTAPNVIENPDSGAPVLPHRVCLKTGFYKGRVVIKPKNA